jgi:low temperature requirement protein LtrA
MSMPGSPRPRPPASSNVPRASERAAVQLTEGPRVSTLELFFDLVFVFTLTQMTTLLAANLGPETAFQVVLVSVVLFWMYGGYAWLTNQVPPDTTPRRILLIAGMAGFMVCALAIPNAFQAGGTGVIFGLGYLAVVVIHGGLYANSFGPDTLRFVPFNVAAAVAVITAGLLTTPLAYALWLAAVPLQLIAAGMSARASGTGLDLHPSHFVERHGLLLLLALGESVVAVGIGIGSLQLDAWVIGVALLGLVIAACLWWAYFVGDEDAAEHALRAAPPRQRVRLALDAYFYAFVPMLLGIIVLAAGVKLSLTTPRQTLSFDHALVLGGGVALFLAADALFRAVLRIGRPELRLLTALVMLATIIVGIFVGAWAQLAAIAGVLIAMLAVETQEAAPARR